MTTLRQPQRKLRKIHHVHEPLLPIQQKQKAGTLISVWSLCYSNTVTMSCILVKYSTWTTLILLTKVPWKIDTVK